MYQSHKELKTKLEAAKPNFKLPLGRIVDTLIDQFDENGMLSGYEVGVARDLIGRAG